MHSGIWTFLKEVRAAGSNVLVSASIFRSRVNRLLGLWNVLVRTNVCGRHLLVFESIVY
jgi:hypothetical protein